MHEGNFFLQDIIDESMPRQCRLSFKRLAHYKNRVVLSAPTGLVDDLEVCDGDHVADCCFEVALRDRHFCWRGGGRSNRVKVVC